MGVEGCWMYVMHRCGGEREVVQLKVEMMGDGPLECNRLLNKILPKCSMGEGRNLWMSSRARFCANGYILYINLK